VIVKELRPRVAGACGFTGDRGPGSSAVTLMIVALSERSVMPRGGLQANMLAGLWLLGRPSWRPVAADADAPYMAMSDAAMRARLGRRLVS
jgi:hypothetical protein